MNNGKQFDRAYQQGAKAYRPGRSRHDECPYGHGSSMRPYWLAGWNDKAIERSNGK